MHGTWVENSDIHVIEIPGEGKEWGRNYSILTTKDSKPQIRSSVTSKPENTKANALRHIIVRLLGLKEKKSK